MKKEVSITGIVNNITYYDKKEGFAIINLKTEEKLIKCTGYLPFITKGVCLFITGVFLKTAKFGEQISIIKYEEYLPREKQDIKKYLASSAFSGIGGVYSDRILERFGEETFKIIFNDIYRLQEVKGISISRIRILEESIFDKKFKNKLIQFFKKYNIDFSLLVKIFNLYGYETINLIEKNPYKIVDDIEGLGFETADKIAKCLNFEKESYVRCRSAIFYMLNQLTNKGHCFADLETLYNMAENTLDIDPTRITMTIDELKRTNEIIAEGNYEKIYLPSIFYSEVGTVKRLTNILNTPRNKKILNRKIKSEINYDETQIKTIDLAMKSKILVITGGAGTGKTTTLKGIINNFKANGFKIILAAPTGKAAKRMSEVTKMEVKTIHRLLEYNGKKYLRNERYQLKGDVLIVDETSMVDIVLMYNLLKAVPDYITLVFVGDVNQLPSVKSGNVFEDIINSKVIPSVKLEKVYRQAEKSGIIKLSKNILEGEVPELINQKDTDTFFIEQNNDIETLKIVLDLVAHRLPKKYKDNIQVISPIKNTDLGVFNLNNKLQSLINKNNLYIRDKHMMFKTNDKVMQIKNNYDKNIFNGDTGIIEKIDILKKNLIVNFDGNKIEYLEDEIEELWLSYAITVHKSQGAEYEIVVLPLSMSYEGMLQKNIFYTAVTRAKKLLIIVGSRTALKKAILNKQGNKRNTFLSDRLKNYIEGKDL